MRPARSTIGSRSGYGAYGYLVREALRSPASVMLVSYEELCGEPERVWARLTSFADLGDARRSQGPAVVGDGDHRAGGPRAAGGGARDQGADGCTCRRRQAVNLASASMLSTGPVSDSVCACSEISRQAAEPDDYHYDRCIVGAGAAGIALAMEFVGTRTVLPA